MFHLIETHNEGTRSEIRVYSNEGHQDPTRYYAKYHWCDEIGDDWIRTSLCKTKQEAIDAAEEERQAYIGSQIN